MYGLHQNDPTVMPESPVEYLRKCNLTLIYRFFLPPSYTNEYYFQYTKRNVFQRLVSGSAEADCRLSLTSFEVLFIVFSMDHY